MMRHRFPASFFLPILLVPLWGQCSRATHPPGPVEEPVRTTPNHAASDPGQISYRQRLLEIADAYEDYSRVDDGLRLAVLDCRVPPKNVLSMSRSVDEKTHGRKLYSLHTDDDSAYHAVASGMRPGVVVKATWEARSRLQGPSTIDDRGILDDPLNLGDFHTPGEKGPLFVMFYEPHQEQWIYGTVSSDGQVTGAGRMRSCIRCHRDAPYGELYGMRFD